MHLERLLRSIPLMIVITIGLGLHAQDSTRHHGIFHPAPLQDRNWHTGFGIVTFATPGYLTEEFRNRVPAIDVQLMRKVHGGLSLEARGLAQVLQNHFSTGVRWSVKLGDRSHAAFHAGLGWWKGHLMIEEFDTDAFGSMFYPAISVGREFGHDVAVTLKAEAIMDIQHRVRVGDIEIEREIAGIPGVACSLYMEQPFMGRSHIALGFTARYSAFFWATWALFDTYTQHLLYRQITITYIP